MDGNICIPGSLAHLIRQLLNENEGTDEDIRLRDILLEGLEVVAVPQLFKEVSNDLKAHLEVMQTSLNDVSHRLLHSSRSFAHLLVCSVNLLDRL